MFIDLDQAAEEKAVCIVRLTTTAWSDKRGVHLKKSLSYLKRRCTGNHFLKEDCDNVGEDDVMTRITNIHHVPDGIYLVKLIDVKLDRESGYAEDWDYELIEINSKE